MRIARTHWTKVMLKGSKETLTLTSLCLACRTLGGVICLQWAWLALSIWPAICSTQGLCFLLASFTAWVFPSQTLHFQCNIAFTFMALQIGLSDPPYRESNTVIYWLVSIFFWVQVSMTLYMHVSKIALHTESTTARLKYNWVLWITSIAASRCLSWPHISLWLQETNACCLSYTAYVNLSR